MIGKISLELIFNNYKINEENETTIFYKNQGDLCIIRAKWEFITYVSLINYDERYQKSKNKINVMIGNCTKKLETIEICTTFKYILNTMFKEVAIDREPIYESIGRYDEEPIILSGLYKNRLKRGLINIVGNAMKALFGVCDNECTQDINNYIQQVENSNTRI